MRRPDPILEGDVSSSPEHDTRLLCMEMLVRPAQARKKDGMQNTHRFWSLARMAVVFSFTCWLGTTAAVAGQAVAVTDTEKIEAALGKELTIEGTVKRVGESKTRSILFINFEGLTRDGFTAIIRQRTLAGEYVKYDPEFAAAFVGKKVRITGTVSEYRGGFQIQIFAPSQIAVVDEVES